MKRWSRILTAKVRAEAFSVANTTDAYEPSPRTRPKAKSRGWRLRAASGSICMDSARLHLARADDALRDLGVLCARGRRPDPAVSAPLFAAVRAALDAAELGLSEQESAPTAPTPAPLLSSPLRVLLAQAESRVLDAETAYNECASKPSTVQGLALLRRAHEDRAIANSAVQSARDAINSASEAVWGSWTASAIALAIARCDAALFATIPLPLSPLNHSDSTKRIMEFSRRIRGLVIKSILTDSENVNAAAAQIESVVAVAFVLFYIYRDLCGVAAVLEALDDSRIQDLSEVWKLVPVECARALQSLRDLTETENFDDIVTLTSDLLTHHYRGPNCRAVIPNILDFISAWPTSAEDVATANNILLLCAGFPGADARVLLESGNISQLLYGPPQYPEVDAAVFVRPMPVPWLLKPDIPVLDDLSRLPDGDLRCMHWVLESHISVLDVEDAEEGGLETAVHPKVDRDASADSDAWSAKSGDSKEALEALADIDPAIVSKLLVAGGGNAPPIAGVSDSALNTSFTGVTTGGVIDDLSALGQESWSDGGEERTSTDDEEYQARFNALSALLPKPPEDTPNKVAPSAVREAVRAVITFSTEEKPRKFTETIELQIGLKNYDPQRDKRFSGTVRLPNIPRPQMKICILADARDADHAKEISLDSMSVEDLKKLNKNKKAIKKLAKKYDQFLASEALIKQIPRLLGPGLSKAGKFPTPVTQQDNLGEKVSEIKATIKFQLKKVLCLGVAVGHVKMTEDELVANIMMSINFLVSLLKKNWQNVKSLFIKSSMGKPVRLY
ncbi:hypothetical protein HDU83_001054 [Entophlyctis luteolus]|nr:hypothetical protein HDU83_001054 [Entophlyctis luteolus]